ncbi:hypothetical protein HZC27_03595 [Candidatus Roizmanbacteria bacterium]|nr:hypothetical protein [Candidatus Roizmanbacteria bacterium]
MYIIYFLFSFLLPTQLGKHFFFDFSYLGGVRIDYLAPTLYLTDILTFLLILLNFKTVFFFFRKKIFLWFLILLFINAIFAWSKPLFFYRLIRIIEVLALFAIFKKQFPRYKNAIIGGFMFFVFVQSILVVTQFITRHSLQGIWYFLGERYFTLSTPGIAKASLQGNEILRAYGTFSHPNSLAGFFLLIYLFFLTNKSITNALLKYLTLALCSLIIFLSFSKNVILVFLFLNTWYFFKEKQSCRVCTLAKILSPLFLALVFLSAQTDPLSFQKRITLMIQSLTIISQHILTGVGLGNYLLAQYAFPIKYSYFFLQPVHNIYLLFVTETGIIMGVFIFVLTFLLLKKYRRNMGVLLILLAVLLTGLSDHYWLTLQQNTLLLGVLFGIIMS